MDEETIMTLIQKIFAVLGIFVFSGLIVAQSKDPNNPTPVTGNVFSGQSGPEGGLFYFSYLAPKGTLKVSVFGQSNEYSTPIRVNVLNKPGGSSHGEIYVVATKQGVTESKTYGFGNKQNVIFTVDLNKDSTLKWQKYTVTLGGAGPIKIPGKKGLPDLTIQSFDFDPSNDKAVVVNVLNKGTIAKGAIKLELTIRKIGASAVGRKFSVDIDQIGPGQKAVTIDASTILPKNVRLQDTTFKIIVDATAIITESNETNNEIWHNLK